MPTHTHTHTLSHTRRHGADISPMKSIEWQYITKDFFSLLPQGLDVEVCMCVYACMCVYVCVCVCVCVREWHMLVLLYSHNTTLHHTHTRSHSNPFTLHAHLLYLSLCLSLSHTHTHSHTHSHTLKPTHTIHLQTLHTHTHTHTQVKKQWMLAHFTQLAVETTNKSGDMLLDHLDKRGGDASLLHYNTHSSPGLSTMGM
jgi:hypothetical protein